MLEDPIFDGDFYECDCNGGGPLIQWGFLLPAIMFQACQRVGGGGAGHSSTEDDV